MNLFDVVYEALMARDPDAKRETVDALLQAWGNGQLTLTAAETSVRVIDIPGRPEKPALVSPLAVKHRGLGTPEGRAALIHALAHIEFNAINLALDAAYRFRDMPKAFYDDWLKVAAEEAYHFSLLRDHLKVLGYDYGDFTAHNGLWDMAHMTAHDPLVRMALVPRLLEARGLDVTPGIRNKLVSVGDHAGAAILDIILRDEIGHVTIGNHWFAFLCGQRELEPAVTFAALLREYNTPLPRPPFNHEARMSAGFTPEEMRWLEEGR